MNTGEMNKSVLIQQLNNPNISARDREILHAMLVAANPQGSVGNLPAENTMVPPVMANNVSYYCDWWIVKFMK